MARGLSTDFKNACAAGTVVPIYFVAIGYASGTYYAWTGINTVVWNTQEWEGQGDLIGVSPITQTSDLQAEGVTVVQSGVPSGNVSSAISEVAQNVPLDIWFGLLNTSDGSIVSDPEHVFSGHIDVPTLQDDGATVTISMSAENALIVLRRSSQRRYTNDDQAIDYPTDTGFSQVVNIQTEPHWGGKNGGSTSGAPGGNRIF